MRRKPTLCLSGLIVWFSYSAAALAADEGQPEVITNSIGMKLVLIPAGEFMMGSRESPEELARALEKYEKYSTFMSPDWLRGEHPQHRVRITKTFYLGACEVTVGEFRRFAKATRYKTEAEKSPPTLGKYYVYTKHSWQNVDFEQTDDHPVVNVSWNDAVAFCDWLSRKEGLTYRLPTEAEWEYACRAGTKTRYWPGDDPELLARVDNVADGTLKRKHPYWDWGILARDGYVFTAPVGSFKANPFGLYDMHGNAMEWCADWYGKEYYSRSRANDPSGPSSGDYRVFRGGGWKTGPDRARSTHRFRHTLYIQYSNFLGFRVARTP